MLECKNFVSQNCQKFFQPELPRVENTNIPRIERETSRIEELPSPPIRSKSSPGPLEVALQNSLPRTQSTPCASCVKEKPMFAPGSRQLFLEDHATPGRRHSRSVSCANEVSSLFSQVSNWEISGPCFVCIQKAEY